MKFPKPKRLRSKKNLERIRSQACLVCQKPPPSDPDHIRTRGSGGGDELWNLIPLCREHHTEKGQAGLWSFVQKYNLPITWYDGWPMKVYPEPNE